MNRLIELSTISMALLLAAGCQPQGGNRYQGYIEGEYIHLASPRPGILEQLAVHRGAEVAKGDPLYSLEAGEELAALREAESQIARSVAELSDARKGRRPEEIQSLEARLEKAKAALTLSHAEFERQRTLAKTQAAALQDLDTARSRHEQNVQSVAEAEADLATAKLGAREDAIAAAEAVLKAREAAAESARWSLEQKRRVALEDAVVFDTLFEKGEWVPAGQPVVSLLPPANIKVRVYVPVPALAGLKVGGAARILRDNADTVEGSISFISPETEFTPPVIYSRETRSKLVVLVEVRPNPSQAAELHPGQPVDVEF